jgi:hypothetical protein
VRREGKELVVTDIRESSSGKSNGKSFRSAQEVA